MNKAIYICAAAMLVLASCSNDEIVERAKENVISFRSMVGMNTRAANMTQSELEAKGMYVTTFDENGDLLYPETHYELDRSVWMANPAQSWGVHDKLNFFLVSPKLDEWQTGFELTKDNKEADLLITVDEEIANQKDYVVANMTASKTDGSVSVGLKHVLSSVEIWAKNTNGAFRYKVKGIRLCGADRKASVNFAKASAVFSAIDTRNYELTYDTPVALGGDAQSIMGDAGNAILPPQPTEGTLGTRWGLETPAASTSTYISVLINVTSKYGASVYPAGSTADNETYGWVAIPVPYEWESGKKYVYTLDFSDGAGRVDPNDPGNAVDAGGIDPAKAKPILGTRIKFGIAVSPWIDGGDQDATLTDGIKFSVGVDSWLDDEKEAELN